MVGRSRDDDTSWFSRKSTSGDPYCSDSWGAVQNWWNFAVVNTARAIPRAKQFVNKDYPDDTKVGSNAYGGDVLVWKTNYGNGPMIHMMLVASHHNGDPKLYQHGGHANKKGAQPFTLSEAYEYWHEDRRNPIQAWAIRIPQSGSP